MHPDVHLQCANDGRTYLERDATDGTFCKVLRPVETVLSDLVLLRCSPAPAVLSLDRGSTPHVSVAPPPTIPLRPRARTTISCASHVPVVLFSACHGASRHPRFRR